MERKNGNRTVSRSFTLEDSLIVFQRYSSKKNFRYVERWGLEPYRYVWLNPVERIVLTYCEGDLIRITCDDQKAFLEELREANEFYSERKKKKSISARSFFRGVPGRGVDY